MAAKTDKSAIANWLFSVKNIPAGAVRVVVLLILGQALFVPYYMMFPAGDAMHLYLRIAGTSALLLPFAISAIVIVSYATSTKKQDFKGIVVDDLTKLPNRIGFIEAMKDLMGRLETRGTLVFFDIDYFDVLKATYGRRTVEHAVLSITHTLREMTQEGDIIGRFPDGEFGLFLAGDDAIRLATVCNTVTKAKTIAVPMNAERVVNATLSLSAGAITLDLNEDLSTLLTHADSALYDAKSKGRGHFVMWSPDMEKIA